MALIDLECPAKFLKSTFTDVSSHRCRLRNNNNYYYYYHYYYCNIYFYSAISITVQREHTIAEESVDTTTLRGKRLPYSIKDVCIRT